MARSSNANTKGDFRTGMAIKLTGAVIGALSDALAFDNVEVHLEIAEHQAEALLEQIRQARLDASR